MLKNKIKNHINFNCVIQSNYMFDNLMTVLWYFTFDNPIKLYILVYLIVFLCLAIESTNKQTMITLVVAFITVITPQSPYFKT